MRAREAVRRLAGQVLGERPVPIGSLARDRRLLRRALRGAPLGRVLVVGSGLAVRHAFPGARVDVAGTSPHTPEVTVCSTVRTPASLPAGRWDTVVVEDPGPDLPARLAVVRRACRAGGRVVLVDRHGWAADAPAVRALAAPQDVRLVQRGRGRTRLWLTVLA